MADCLKAREQDIPQDGPTVRVGVVSTGVQFRKLKVGGMLVLRKISASRNVQLTCYSVDYLVVIIFLDDLIAYIAAAREGK